MRRTDRAARVRLPGLLLAAGLLAAAAPGCSHPSPLAPMATTAHTYEVYDRRDLILVVSDAPGPITSTAPPPPGGAVTTHPFLSGAAKSAAHEGRLRELLDASTSFDDFLARLREAGFRVEPEGDE